MKGRASWYFNLCFGEHKVLNTMTHPIRTRYRSLCLTSIRLIRFECIHLLERHLYICMIICFRLNCLWIYIIIGTCSTSNDVLLPSSSNFLKTSNIVLGLISTSAVAIQDARLGLIAAWEEERAVWYEIALIVPLFWFFTENSPSDVTFVDSKHSFYYSLRHEMSSP